MPTRKTASTSAPSPAPPTAAVAVVHAVTVDGRRPGPKGGPAGGEDVSAPGDRLPDRIREVLDLIRPAVQEDGGDVEFVTITPEGIVHVRFHGACVGCPSSGQTLQTGIERTLRDRLPEVRGVIAVP